MKMKIPRTLTLSRKTERRSAMELRPAMPTASGGLGSPSIFDPGRDLEVPARIAGHESTRTMQLYNRLREEISLDEIERSHI